MLPSRARTVAVATVSASALVLAACGSDSDSPVDQIEVTSGSQEKAPTISIEETPLTTTETESKVLTEGDGAELADDDIVQVDLAMFNAKDGKAIENSETYTAEPTMLDLSNQEMLPGLSKAIRGTTVGSEGVAIIPPKDLFGEEGMSDLGISGTDNVVLVFDVRRVIPAKAEGEKVAPDSDLPKVTWKEDGPASFDIPDEEAPDELVVEPLIKGEGDKVESGQTVYVTYTGALWRNGEVFDSTQQEGRGPFTFEVGAEQVITAWDEGLEGQTVGSRVLLVVPPEDGYGEEGSPDGSIKGDDTLVFVVDILDAS
ncbi:FKBP-type peptidyl-prolyl cis-trans isomerase [Janibacter alkaliphilus]